MVVKLKFISNLDYQMEAIRSVTDLLQGVIGKAEDEDFSSFNSNGVLTSKETLNENLEKVQRRNGLDVSKVSNLKGPSLYDRPNFNIEMETGTGKTYIYLRTILELNKLYGLRKFVIVVPSVAIREGVSETLRLTRPHFQRLYDRIPYNFSIFSSDKMNSLISFCRSGVLEIMIITIQSFNKKEINTLYAKGRDDILNAESGMDMLSSTRPVVILDEPHKMSSELSGSAISEMNPLFVLRYSATHRDIENTHFVYSLGPSEAHDLGLVKKVDVIGTSVRHESSLPLVKLIGVNTKDKIRAKVILKAKIGGGYTDKTFTLSKGDSLAEKTRNPSYNDLIVSNISVVEGNQFLELSDGEKIKPNDSIGDTYIEVAKEQISSTIKTHLDTQEKLREFGVKVLSLFFVDEVTDYQELDPSKSGVDEELSRIDPEKYLFVRRFFDETFNRLKKGYSGWENVEPEDVRGAYFSARKTFKSISQDKDKIDEILKDKEKLLSFESPTSFIFTHSALGEGWDNPNVFNVCTLRITNSEVTKRQTIGRGLRIPVNQEGERFEDSSLNVLTVIANESYEDFARALQNDYIKDGIVKLPPIRNRGERVISNLREIVFKEKFSKIWEKLSIQTDFFSNIDTDELIEKSRLAIQENLIVKKPLIDVRRAEIEITEKGIVTQEKESEPVRQLKLKYYIPDIVSRLSTSTGLTKRTISRILIASEKTSEVFKNPEDFISKVSYLIKDLRIMMEVRNSNYFKTDKKYSNTLFKKEVPSYRPNVVEAGNSVYDKVLCDTQSEIKFAEKASADEQVEVFSKLPDSYYIKTPLGRYRPDWAIVYRRKRVSGKTEEQIYLVCETKFGYVDISGTLDSVPMDQQGKIICASKHFSLIEGLYYSVVDSYQAFKENIP
jgi:type III restriction enzyme